MINVHTLTLHETNRQGYVPVCGCGWIGLTHATRAVQRKKNGQKYRLPDESRAAATDEHAAHVERCARPLVDRMNP